MNPLASFVRSVLQRFNPPPREVVYVPWDRADQMLLAQEGWRIAREEDSNHCFGMVYLERDAG